MINRANCQNFGCLEILPDLNVLIAYRTDCLNCGYLTFLFQMDPSRISKEDAHCVRMLFRSQESIDMQDMPFENQEVKLMPESCRRMKQALQRAVQKVSGR